MIVTLVEKQKQMIYKFCITLLAVLSLSSINAQEEPVRLGIAGLSHGHVGWILNRDNLDDIKLVGIVEQNKELAKRLSDEYGFSMDMVYDTLEEMIAATNPEAMAAFGTIYDHLSVVEACAPKGIHVMVEKPLAISLDHAKKMEALAIKYNIHLLTNYETSWYPTNVKAFELFNDGAIGELRKVIVRDGHRGMTVVGVESEFVQWLTDPTLSGGGAIMDFGCYGANLMTWLLEGEWPNSVTAVTQQLQPEINPKVDDEATIILKYNDKMALIQPSWNWTIGRKDMELYGSTGVLYSDNQHQLRLRKAEGYSGFSEETFELDKRESPFDDPFAVFAAVVRGKLTLDEFDPYTLKNNMITMSILDAALKSATVGRTIKLQDE